MKKKTLSRVGAGALAIATVVAGLSFGPAAANAAPGIQLHSSSGQRGLPTLAAGQSVTGEGYGMNLVNPNNSGVNGAMKFEFDAPRGTTYPKAEVRWGNRTGGTGTWTRGTYGPDQCALSDGSTKLVCDIPNVGIAGTTGGNQLGGLALWVDMKADDPLHANGLIEDGSFKILSGAFDNSFERPLSYRTSGTEALGAWVVSQDLHARTATISGYGKPGSTFILNDTDAVIADEDGQWTYTVVGLKLGKNPIAIEEYDGDNNQIGATSVTVDLAVAPISAAAMFLPDHEKNVEIVGTAQAGADVEVYQGDRMIKTLKAADISGRFSVDMPAPNVGGVQTYTIKQRVDGELAAESLDVTADFGAAVSITSPVQDAEHGGGALRFQGRGAVGSDIALRLKGTQNVVGAVKVLANGIWTIDASNIPAKKATYVVSQHSKGNNTTTAEVTLNPDADYQDVTVTAPVSGSEFDANTSVRFTGQGTPGGVVTLTPTNGAASVSTTVDEDGNWAINRFLGNGPYTFNVTQVADGRTSHVNGIALTPKSTAPIDKAFAVTSPATGSSVKNQAVTFTGTGAAGTTVRIKTTNFASSDITTTVKNDGTWSVNKWIGDGPYVMDITQEGRVTGAVRGFEINNDVAVNKPFAVTTPTAGDDIRGKVATFTGTGRHGEVVTIKATSPSGLADVTGIVKKDGTWSINRFIGDGPYAFDIIQTKNGVESGSVRDFRINQPAKGEGVTGPFVVTGPATGSTFTPNTQVTFAGTGTTGATVTVTPTNGASAVTTVVGTDGTWSVKKFLGNGAYTFELTSVKDGATETAADISITPAP